VRARNDAPDDLDREWFALFAIICAPIALHGAGRRNDLDVRGVVHYNIARPPTSWLLAENYTINSEGAPHATAIGWLGRRNGKPDG
jgi:hypothetical protein